MIKPEYKKVFDEFMENYEEINVIPYHSISKEEFYKQYEEYITNNDINNIHDFIYFMTHMIKVLNGKIDAHTSFSIKTNVFPVNFRIFDDEVLVNYPEEEKGNKLISINGIPIEQILKEIEYIISYGTEGKRKWELEQILFQKVFMISLPSLKDEELLTYEFEDQNGNKYTKEFDTTIKDFPDKFNTIKFRLGDPGSHEIRDNCLIIYHTSVQKEYEEQLKQRYEELDNIDLSDIDRIIVDIRINGGGNSRLNNYLFEFLNKHKDKELITLTGYRVFSGGRYALLDLKEMGALTIGEEIATPLNCCGNSHYIDIKNEVTDHTYTFTISESYLDPYKHKQANSKEQFNELFTKDDLELNIFKPDIYVTQSKEDFINGYDTILEYAINYKKENIKTHH